MKIDLTAAARVLLLNCADVGRVRIAKHTRQADGGIAAGVRADVRLSKAKSTKCSRSRNTSSPVTYCFRRAAISSVPMASRHSTNTSPSFGACRTQTTSLPPPLILPPAGEGRVGATDPGGQCCGSGPFATTAGGTAGAQQPPAASPPLGRCRRRRHLHRGRGLRRMRSPFCRSGTIEEVRLMIGLLAGPSNSG